MTRFGHPIAHRIEAEGMNAYASELLPRLVATRTLATRPDVWRIGATSRPSRLPATLVEPEIVPPWTYSPLST